MQTKKLRRSSGTRLHINMENICKGEAPQIIKKLLASTLVIPPIADVWEECLAGGSDCL